MNSQMKENVLDYVYTESDPNSDSSVEDVED